MRRILFALGAMLIAVQAAPAARAAETFAIDRDHSNVVFLVDHLGFARVFGRFNDFSGEFSIDEANIEKSKVRVVIRTKSIDTNYAKRDEHLRSPDFFSVREFPEMVFESKKVKRTGDRTADITGNLKLIGRTLPVTLKVRLNRKDAHPLPQYRGVMTAGFSARTTIKRSAFGMNYGQSFLGDDIEIWIEVEGQVKPAE